MEGFRCLELDMSIDGIMGIKIHHQVGEKAKVVDALRSVWKEKSLYERAKIVIFEVVVLMILFEYR